MNVANGAAALAAQVLMGIAGVGIVALGTTLGGNLEDGAAREDGLDAARVSGIRPGDSDGLVGRLVHLRPAPLRGPSRVCYRRAGEPR